MSVRLLYEKNDLMGYVRDRKSPTALHGDRWIFVHIPETVPYQIREVIADAIQPDVSFVAGASAPTKDHDTHVLEALKSFCETDEFRTTRFISGHIKLFQITATDKLADFKRLTILRDPIDRVLSDYNAQRNISEDASIRDQVVHLVEFAKQPMNQNVSLQFLAPKGIWRPKECIESIISEFDFVGIREDYNMSLKLFYSLLGMRLSPTKLELPDQSGSLKRGDIPADILKTIAQLNGADYEIYRFFHDRFVALRDEFFQLNDYGRMFKLLAAEEERKPETASRGLTT